MTEAPRVEVIVLNYNGRGFLERCLAALDHQTFCSFTVTAVDNASTDGSQEWLKAVRPGTDLLAMSSNLGFAGAYDRAIRASQAELVAMLNNDAEPDPGWLAALVGALDRHPEAAAATSRIRFAGDESRLNHAGGVLSPLGSGFDIGFGQPDGPRFDRERYCGAPSGAACLVRRRDFIAAGGFDRRYFAWFEDVDLGWRLWLSGRCVLYVPGATVRHVYGGTGGGRSSALRVYHCQKNRLANATTNLSLSGLVLALAAGLGYDLLRTGLFLRRRDAWPLAAAIWRGWFAYGAWLPSLVRRRRGVQSSRRLSDATLRGRGALAGWLDSGRAFVSAERARKETNRGVLYTSAQNPESASRP